MSQVENIQNSLNVETPEQIETTNVDVPATSGVSGIDKITTSLNYSNNFTNFELEKARDCILNSGLDLKNTKYVNITFNRLQPKQIGAFINHLLYSKKMIPSNDICSAFAINSLSMSGGNILNSPNGQVLFGPVGTGPFGSDSPSTLGSGTKVNRTFVPVPNYTSIADGFINKLSNSGGFTCHATENLLKRYDRLVKDQGQLTKGVEKAFDNKGYPVLEAQAALECYGKNKLCFTKEIIGEVLYALSSAGRGRIRNTSGQVYVWDRSYMNAQNINDPSLNRKQSVLVSRAQTPEDFTSFIGRMLCVDNVNDYPEFVAPLTDLPQIISKTDYVGFDETAPPKYNEYRTRAPFTISKENMMYALDRYYNGTVGNFVGYKDYTGSYVGKWGTIISQPTFTDVAGYNSYIADSAKFTPFTSTYKEIDFPSCEEAYNVQDVLTGLSYAAEKYGKYRTPYGDVNMNGSTGDNNEVQIFTCPAWSRIGHLLGFLEFDLEYSTILDSNDALIHNKLYHYTRYKFGLFLNGITKFIGACDNYAPLTSSPRTAAYTKRLVKNLYSIINFSYFMPDENSLHFIYPLAKTYGADYSANLLWTCNGTYTPGTLFNDYQNANITGPLSSSTADLSYRTYLEDYQWWRGDMFGNLNEQDLTVMHSAGSSLSLIRQSKDNFDSIVLEHGYYASQGCDSCEIDLWSDAYGSTEKKKVRLINWNNTDTVVKFVQPVLFAWSGVVTAIRLGGMLSVATANTFVPAIPMASYPYWANLAKNVSPSVGYDLNEDF